MDAEEIERNGCKNAAEWIVYTGNGPDDYTNTCTAHVGEMLIKGENKVLPAEEGSGECCFIGGQP